MPALIRLRLQHPPRLQVYPARLHGAACTLLERPDADHTAQLKPFATTPLHTDTPGTAIWQLGWLPDHTPPTPPTAVHFGDTTCPVLDHHHTHHTYLQLATTAPVRTVELTITSPMYFSRNGRDHPLPDPVLITRNLITRWNYHAPPPAHITDQHTRDLIGHIYLTHLDGHTVRARTTYASYQTGYLGTVTLALPTTAPPHTHHTLAALAHYAPIAGIGAQTTHGYGSCHLTHTTPA
ncbi:CRISPR system precrRNA processing endoribonuclease RAMP protein Cas6 [Nocardia sp. NPDC050697]|uniref:CRISPR system precrRNA processing endoribonuclease RAMP protein Cas6 n=1 Tax=Nocardia sp. NPDC050697 TaxID=3155158 RepID=UPI003405ED2C